MGRSIVLKLWTAMMALFVVTIVPLGFSLNTTFTRYHHDQTAQPLREHVIMLAQMVIRNADTMNMIPTIAADIEAEWALVGPDLQIVRASALVVPELPAGVLNAIRADGMATGEVSFHGIPYTFAVGRLSERAVTAIVLFKDAAPAQATLHWLRLLLLLGGLGVTLLATGLAFWLSKRLTQPLIEMQQATRAIARGDQAEVIVQSQDELGELASAINELSGQLYRLERNRREFLTSVAHELKTPLSYIRGFSQALNEDVATSPDQKSRSQQIIYRESLRLSSLVDDLLDLAQLEEGRFALEKHPVLLHELLAETANQVHAVAQANGVNLQVKGVDINLQVSADPFRLAQVMLNLVDNALKHTSAGGAVVLAAAGVEGGVQVEVRDTGAGIPPEELSLIWERFHKVDRSRSTRGSGLGLAIVREIVKAHGGEISAESAVGKGTRISIWLPSDGQ